MVQVNLHIAEDFYADYLRNQFKTINGQILINTKNPLGGFINSNILISDLPKYSFGQNFITLKSTAYSDLKKENKFLYFDELATQRINKAIAFYFDTDFRQFCISGYEKGIKFDIIIKSFIRIMKLRSSQDIYERLKKRDYRRRVEIDKLLIEAIGKTHDNDYPFENQ